MPALLEDTPCPSCGRSHDLFLDQDDYFSGSGRYEYRCPATGQATIVLAAVANRIVDAAPQASVRVWRVELP
jgi:hypothetical protein